MNNSDELSERADKRKALREELTGYFKGLTDLSISLAKIAEQLARSQANGAKPAEWLSVAETSKRLGVSRKAVYAAVKRGELRSRPLGRRVLICQADMLPSQVQRPARRKRRTP